MLRGPLTRLTVVVAVTSTALVGLNALAVGSATADGQGPAPTQPVYGPSYDGPPIYGPTAKFGVSSLYSPVATDHQGRKFQ